MTTVADLDSGMTYEELEVVYFENCEPFLSLNQCQLFLKVAARLRFIVAEEVDQGGDRLRSRDVDSAMQIARRSQAAFGFCTDKPTHIIPPDELR